MTRGGDVTRRGLGLKQPGDVLFEEKIEEEESHEGMLSLIAFWFQRPADAARAEAAADGAPPARAAYSSSSSSSSFLAPSSAAAAASSSPACRFSHETAEPANMSRNAHASQATMPANVTLT